MPDVNIFGKYPVCKPVVGDTSSRCERCGGYAGRDLPCPAIPPEKRWGESSGEWLLVTVQSRLGDSVQLAGDSRINGASYKSPALQYASPGETWAIYWTRGVGLFGRIEFAFNLHPNSYSKVEVKMSNWQNETQHHKTTELTCPQRAALLLETIETRLNKHRATSECEPFIFEDCAHCGGREMRERLTVMLQGVHGSEST